MKAPGGNITVKKTIRRSTVQEDAFNTFEIIVDHDAITSIYEDEARYIYEELGKLLHLGK